AAFDELAADGRAEMARQGVAEERTTVQRRVHLRYSGTDSPLVVPFGSKDEIVAAFEAAHRQRYGFVVPDRALVVEAISAEVIGASDSAEDPILPLDGIEPSPPVGWAR